MKVRTAFVANSSSSSFIIGVDRLPESLEYAGEVFFGGKKDYVAPIIIQGMYEDFQPITVDFSKILAIVKRSKSISKLESCWREDAPKEKRIISEVLGDYVYQAKNDFKGWWGGGATKYEKFEEAQLAEMHIDVKNDSWQIVCKAKEKITDKWFNLTPNKEALVRHVEIFVNKFKDCPVILEAEFSDESTLGSELEHGDHWDKMKAVQRFSHH